MIDRINESLINLHINDPTRPINPLVKVGAIYYSVETAGKIQDILLSLDSNGRTECAIKVATNYKVRELIRYLPYYGIVDEENKFRLAYVCAKNNGRVTAREINKFEITSNEALFSIAKMCIKQNPRGFLEYTENFISLSDIQLKVLAGILLLKEPESFGEIHLFFNGSKPVERFLTVENIKNWVKENLGNELSEEIYRDSKRRDVGIRLLGSYLLSGNNENILTSKMMIENSTGFPASSLEGIEDKHSTEIYSSILDIYAHFLGPIFLLFNFGKNLFQVETIEKLEEFLKEFNKLAQLLTIEGNEGVSLIKRIFGMLNDKKIEVSLQNIENLIFVMRSHFRVSIEKDIEKTGAVLGIETSKLLERILCDEVTLTLVSRYRGRTSWNNCLIPLFRGLALGSESFQDYKYQGYTEDRKDIDMAREQLSFLSVEQKKSWRKNTTHVEVIEVGEPNNEESLKKELRNVFSRILNTIDLKEDIKIDVLGIVNLKPKELQNYLKSNYGHDKEKMLIVICRIGLQIESLQELLEWVVKIKGIQDFIGLSKSQKDEIKEVSNKAYIKKKKFLVINFFTDRLDVGLRVGEMVDAISCHNPASGAYINVIPSYIVDANIKMNISYILSEKDFIEQGIFNLMLKAIHQNSLKNEDISLNVTEVSEIVIPINGKEYKIKKRPHLRQIVKIGKTEDENGGIIAEPALTQTHIALEATERVTTNQLENLAKGMGISYNTREIKIPLSRNPSGTYSDVEDGIQTGEYILHPKA